MTKSHKIPDNIMIEEKKSTILHDGRQFMIKIPKRFSDILGLEKGEKADWTFTHPKKGEKEATLELRITRTIEVDDDAKG